MTNSFDSFCSFAKLRANVKKSNHSFCSNIEVKRVEEAIVYEIRIEVLTALKEIRREVLDIPNPTRIILNKKKCNMNLVTSYKSHNL